MIKSIYIQNRAGYLCNNGDPTYSLPIELETFTCKTANSVLIMDRNTWESLPESLRPLSNCITVVVSPTLSSDIGVSVFPTLKEALESFDTDENIWITGRTDLLQEAMEHVDEIHQTIVADDTVGDSNAPIIPDNFGRTAFSIGNDGSYVVGCNIFNKTVE